MNQNITLKQAKEFKKQTNSDTALRLARNAAMRGDIEDLAMDWEAFRRIDHTFSDMVSGEMPVTNQKSSGRCWGFAGLNLFRIYLGRKYNLKKSVLIFSFEDLTCSTRLISCGTNASNNNDKFFVCIPGSYSSNKASYFSSVYPIHSILF